MSDKYSDAELDLILKYNYDPYGLTKEQLSEIKNSELVKCIDFLDKYEEGFKTKKPKLDSIDPTYWVEVVEPEIDKIRQILLKYNAKQLPLDFYNKSFKKTIENLQIKLNFELEARLNYLAMMKKLQLKK